MKDFYIHADTAVVLTEQSKQRKSEQHLRDIFEAIRAMTRDGFSECYFSVLSDEEQQILHALGYKVMRFNTVLLGTEYNVTWGSK